MQFEMAKEYLKPTIGGTIVDASCGSGLFSRLFVRSGMFSQVIALDFSENMLRQCSEFVEKENIPNEYTFDHPCYLLILFTFYVSNNSHVISLFGTVSCFLGI